MEIEQALKLASDLLVQHSMRPLSDVETALLRGAWENLTYEAIAKKTGYSSGYLCKNIGPILWRDLTLAIGQSVGKNNVRAALERLAEQKRSDTVPPVLSGIQSAVQSSVQPLSPQDCPSCQADWGEAMEIPIFLGRFVEQETLNQWISRDRCRFILLSGMGGIGKTTLAIRVAHQVQSDFEFVIWRSLRNAPPALELLVDLIKFFAQQQDVEIPRSAEAAGLLLLQYLRKHRCLLVLDNAETLLQGDRYGYYQSGYEDYGRLFHQISEIAHMSCLIVTSRERPRDLVPKVGMNLPVRSLVIKGLSYVEGRDLISGTGQFTGDLVAWQLITERYAGNPLALKIAASFIHEVCNGDLYEFLAILGRSSFIFDDIRDILNQQFQRLSLNERTVMFWLAIKREPVAIQALAEDFLLPIPPLELLQVVFALQGRALIEKIEVKQTVTEKVAIEETAIERIESRFTQQPVVMEYVTAVLIEQLSEQICSWQGETIASLHHLRYYALLQALAPDDVQSMQRRFILQPVLEKLKTHFGEDTQIKQHLLQITDALRGLPSQETGYGAGNIINLLRHLHIDLQGCDFSDQTVWQAHLQDLPLYNVNFSQSDLSKSCFSQNFGWIQAVAFSPNGDYLAGGDSSGLIHLWNCKTEQRQLVLKGHQSHINTIAFSPDSQYLASGSFDGAVKLWRIHDGQCLLTTTGHTNITTGVTFHRDGHRLASCSIDGTIKLWNTENGECITTLTVDSLPIRGLVFAQDQRYLISGCADYLIRVWDTETGKCVQVLQGHTAAIRSIDISPDGQTLVSAGDDNTVKVWQLQSNQCLQTLQGHQQVIFSVAFSPSGEMVASAGADQTVRLWNVADGRCVACFREHTSIVFGVAFSSDGNTLASGSMDRMVKLWNVAKRCCFRTFSGHKNVIWSVAVFPQSVELVQTFNEIDAHSRHSRNAVVATGSFDGKIRLWDILDGQCFWTMSHSGEVLALALSPDGKTLISGNASHQSSLKFWDLQSQTCLKTIPAHVNMAKTLCFSHNGLLFASGGGDRIVQLFHRNENHPYRKLEGHHDTILSIAFSKNDALLVSGSIDRTARIWDVQTGQCLQILTGYQNPVISVKFHPHEPILLTGEIDSLKLWSLQDQQWQPMLTIREGYTVVTAIAFTVDGKLMATGSFDRTVRLWDFASRKCLRIIQTPCCMYSVTFSPDDRFLIGSGDDGSVRVWQVETGECFRVIKLPDLYAGMNIRAAQGITKAQQDMLLSLGAVC